MNIRKVVIFAGCFVVGSVIGGVFGYQYAKQALQDEFNTRLDEEIQANLERQNRIFKRGDFETIEKAAEKLYKGPRSGVEFEDKPPFESPLSSTPDHELRRLADALAVERGYRAPDEEEQWVVDSATQMVGETESGDPHIITVEMFNAGEKDYLQPQLIYYKGDDVLVNDRSEIIEDRDVILGPSALKSFGHGSNNPDIVFIRNHSEGADFEVLREHGSFKDRDETTGSKRNSKRSRG
jgi:hypothetical protein